MTKKSVLVQSLEKYKVKCSECQGILVETWSGETDTVFVRMVDKSFEYCEVCKNRSKMLFTRHVV